MNSAKQGGLSQMAQLKLRPVAAACLVALMAGASYAQTAEAPKQEDKEANAAAEEKEAKDKAVTNLGVVKVSGIRRGIEASISVKKNATSIVEAIAAEDIGKLPDVSVAESLSRLPGLTAQRSEKSGRAQSISIRGMAGDFATTLMNGREQASTGDSRSAQFDQYPGELQAGAVVYKTSDSTVVGAGLSGTVDLQTIRPLSFDKTVAAVNLRDQTTGVGNGKEKEGNGDRMSLVYIDQFLDRTLGVGLGYARFKEQGARTSRFEGWGSPDLGGLKVPGGFNAWEEQTDQTREGMFATLQFKPTKNFESMLDVFQSKFDIQKDKKGFQAPMLVWGGGGETLAPGYTSSNGVVTSGRVNNFRGVIRNDAESTKEELQSIGWVNKLKVGEGRVVLDLARSTAESNGAILETTAGLAKGIALGANDYVEFSGFDGGDLSKATYTFGRNYGDPSVMKLADVRGWGGSYPQAGYSKLPQVKDVLNSGRLSYNQPVDLLGLFTNMEVGANLTSREKNRAFNEGRLELLGSSATGPVDIPGASSGSVLGFPVVLFDPVGNLGSVYRVATKALPDIYNKTWTVNEKATTVYGKLDLDTELMGFPVTGNAGLQVVRSNVSTDGFLAVSENIGPACPDDVCPAVPLTANQTYTDVLPSLNLNFDLGRDQFVRLGLAKTMARPTVQDQRANVNVSLNNQGSSGFENGNISVDAGNPYLKPIRATAFDISYEKYFGNKAYVGVAAFYKDLHSYVLKVEDRMDATGLYDPAKLPPGVPSTAKLYQPVNATGGRLSGTEWTANLPVSLFAPDVPVLNAFGVKFSLSDTSSAVSLPSSGFSTKDVSTATIPLPGLSRQVQNTEIYFEKNGFQARVSERARSSFVGEVADIFGDRQLTYIKGDKVTDWQIGYEFQDGWLKGLSFLGQVLNANNTEFVRYRDTEDQVVERIKFGKTYLFGVNYKL
jgi:iron complex outermembrane receptor protein